MEDHDRTIVSGAQPTSLVPRRGEVVGERYEVRHVLREDPFSFGLLALDHESEAQVMLRLLRPELLADEAEGRKVAQKLQSVVGAGGHFLPGLIDADRDRTWVYAVEPVPAGAPLREVIERRKEGERRFRPEEVLPVVARLAAALAAVPPPWRHGDVRAAHVWVEPQRLTLASPFLLAALPERTVAAVLSRHPDLARRYAPEVARGGAGDAADRYGVAVIAYEALSGEEAPQPGAGALAHLGAVGRALGGLLEPDPRRRASSLEPLVEALAALGGLAPPTLDPGVFRKARRLAVPRPGSRMNMPAVTEHPDTDPDRTSPGTTSPDHDDLHTTSVDTLAPPSAPDTLVPPPAAPRIPSLGRQIPGAAAEGTQEITTDQLLEAGFLEDTDEKTNPRADVSDIDPRLARAALGMELESSGSHKLGDTLDDAEDPDALDPRLVRAALGLELEKSGESALPEEAPSRSPARRRAASTTLELGIDELEMVAAEAGVPSPRSRQPTPAAAAPEAEPAKPRPRRKKPEIKPERVAIPEGVKPLPRVRKPSLAGAPAPAVVLFDDSLPGAAPAPAPAPAPAATPRAPSTHPPSRPAPARAGGSSAGRWIVILAVLLGAIIIAGSLTYTAWRRSQADQEEQRRLQERFERLQRGE